MPAQLKPRRPRRISPKRGQPAPGAPVPTAVVHAGGEPAKSALPTAPAAPNLGVPIQAELQRILETLVIESPVAFTFGGRRIQVDGATRLELPYVAPAAQNPLIAALQLQFYQHCYARRFADAIADPTPSADAGKDLTADLAQANAGRERWETGWQIAQVLSSGQIAVQRNGLSRLLWPGEYLVPDGSVGMPSRGSFVSVYCKKHSTALQPGFYFAFGETLPDQQDETGPLRFYWNIQAGGITDLMSGLTQALNRFQIPFRFKCLARAAHYDRADAAVLYVARRLYRIVAELLPAIYQKVAHHLRPDTPLFSKTLAAGLGLAEDPGNGESFGSHRCRLVAEAISHSEAQGRRTAAARLEEIEKHFKQLGFTLAAPYLGPGSRDDYEWPVGEIALS
ncbi:MAG TPA: T3SS effector HopA1 family protein [Candidatus Acidoferrales bacterium]|nr:T3SS effector HopA1 family protein [Candidatus Acidoferrales bacterium]